MANEQQPKSKQGDLLSSFLGSVDSFMEKLSAQVAAAAPEGNERIIIQSTGDAIISQTKKLTNYIRQIVAPLTPVQRRELDAFMRIQDGDAMANRAIEISAKVLASPGNGLTMNFLSWLQENVHTLKKIILAILALLGKIFGFTLPSWIQDIINIIDEIIDLLLGHLGGLFGLRASQVADELSKREVNFIKEMTALAAWQSALNSRPAEEEA